MGVGVERFQHHLLGSKQEELQCAADLGEGASWWNRPIKAIPNVATGAPPHPQPPGKPRASAGGPPMAHTPLAKARLPGGRVVEERNWTMQQT